MNDFIKRALVIALVAPPVLVIIWFGGRPFSALIAFACVMLVFEWTRIVDQAEFSTAFYALSFTTIFSMFIAAGGGYGVAIACATLGAGVSAIAERLNNRPYHWPIIGVLYLVIPCIAFLWIRGLPDGRGLILFLVAMVWATDIGAYLFGKAIGGPKLLPQISPKKTWAGAIGGGILAMLVGVIFWVSVPGFEAAWLVLGGAVGLAIFAVLGDVAESALKRYFGVKDSGGYLPGHGGILDRVDGLIFSTSALALVLLVQNAILSF